MKLRKRRTRDLKKTKANYRPKPTRCPGCGRKHSRIDACKVIPGSGGVTWRCVGGDH